MEALKITALSVISFAGFLVGGALLTIVIDFVRHLEAHFRGGYVGPGTTLRELKATFALLPKFLKAAIARIPTVEGPMVGFLWRRTKNVLFLVGLAQAVSWTDGYAGGRLTASAKSGRDRAVAWWTSKPEDRLGPLARQVWERLARAEDWRLDDEHGGLSSVAGDLWVNPVFAKSGLERSQAGVYTGQTSLTHLLKAEEQEVICWRALDVKKDLEHKRQEALAAQLAAGPFPGAGNGGRAGDKRSGPASATSSYLSRLPAEYKEELLRCLTVSLAEDKDRERGGQK